LPPVGQEVMQIICNNLMQTTCKKIASRSFF
jgi:hypothetical protein